MFLLCFDLILGIFLQKLSQQSLPTFPESDGNEPGYETVVQTHKSNAKKDGSDYDPNYETLRPTIKTDSIDHYAKVLNKSNIDSNDGYSSIKPVKNKLVSNEEDENLGYCTISDDRVPAPVNHDYASIRDTAKEDENVYSSLTIDMEHEVTLPNRSKSPSQASTPSPIVLSPSKMHSLSTMSNMSDTKTLTSPSSDGESTTNTPICYNNLRSTDRSQLTVSVSNYESLTGSESDSNYESVRYLNAKDRENPYEQLYNESDIKYDTLKRDDTAGSVSGLYSTSSKSADFGKNSSLSSSGSGLAGQSSSSLNNNSDTNG